VAKLTKPEARQHEKACELLAKDVLTNDDKWFVLQNWQEAATNNNTVAGAFFTPPGLAADFAIDACGHGRVIDLCAGIGGLSFAVCNRMTAWKSDVDRAEYERRFTLIELNPAYIEVGKKIMPHANWVQASVFELPADLGRFECSISNPPFGKIKHDGAAPRYKGSEFEYKVIDIASQLSGFGCFIIPQGSAPFVFSGRRCYEERSSAKHSKFLKETGIVLSVGCGVDTTYHVDDWHGVAPVCEIVTAEFSEYVAPIVC
jgi:hypothetical protein